MNSEVDLGDVAVFVKVVETGGFSAAARALLEPKSSVSRRVAHLERALGTRLLHRTTRTVALTESGSAYYARVAPALADLDVAAGLVRGEAEQPRGTIRLTAPPDVGNELLPSILADFVRRYPEVRVEIDLSAETPNLIEGGFDLALRGTGRNDESLAATKLQDTAFRLYASADYLDQHPAPTHPDELADHSCVLFRSRDGKSLWQLQAGQNTRADVMVAGTISANDLSFVRRAAIAAAGIALLPEVVAIQSVVANELLPVLPNWWAGGSPLYLVYASRQHLPLRVTALRDHLLRHFPE